MRPVNEKLAEQLLAAGKREFLEQGFQKASLRNIAAAVGVTTGAIYRYYTDKESLFDALVAGPAGILEEEYRAVQRAFADLPLEQQLSGLPEVTEDGHAWMMNFIYDHLDEFRLIVCASAGTRYEHYIDTLVDIEVNASRVLIDRMKEAGLPVQDIDDELIHIVASCMFNGMFETVRHDMPRGKAMQHVNSLRDFYSAGWFKLLGISGG